MHTSSGPKNQPEGLHLSVSQVGPLTERDRAIHKKPLADGRILFHKSDGSPWSADSPMEEIAPRDPVILTGEDYESPTSNTPNRKVVSQGLGGALGGHVAVIVAYYDPSLPPEIVGSYTAILVVALGFLAGYLVRPEEG